MAESDEDGGQQLTWAQVFIGLAVIVGAVIAGAFTLYAAVTDDEDDGGAATIPSIDVESRLVEVTYRVTGTADSVGITIETPSGTSQASNRAVPLAREDGGQGLVMTFERGAFVYISAQNEGASGSVTCTIEGSDGQTISTATSEGAYVIASCDGEAS